MRINRDKHWKFLEDELRAETEVFARKFYAKAEFLLKDVEEMYVGQFLAFRNGEMVMKFPNSRTLPRKNESLFCMVLPKHLRDYRNWGNMTYCDLFNERFKGTDCSCIWSNSSEDPQFSLVGFRNIDLEFVEFLEKNDARGTILVFAPQRPPIEYVVNLQRIVNDSFNEGVAMILDSDYQVKEWSPVLIQQENVSLFVKNQLHLVNTMILQGPPGTGKTHLIAELCAQTCAEGKTVLVTSLTNRSLMEIASKPALRLMLEQGKIMKTNMTADEYIELQKLVPVKQIVPVQGCLILSTYFIASGFAAESTIDAPFDYVIMDEASQAVLAMFAAAKKIGKVNFWVGDVKQLPPIVSLNEDRLQDSGYRPLVEGFKLLSDASVNPVYQLVATYRFGQRAANYTGVFYGGTLVSKMRCQFWPNYGSLRFLHAQGGPALVLTDMVPNDYAPQFAVQMVSFFVGAILSDSSDTKVSVLTCMVRTVKTLQKCINQKLGLRANVLVDTVARVQGLTTDITILLIPNVSYLRSLESRLFNVATSRARMHTIIIADKDIFRYSSMPTDVRIFLEKLFAEQVVYIPAESDLHQLSTAFDNKSIGE